MTYNPPPITNPNYELFDPEVYPPPRGVPLQLINEGGTLKLGHWYDGALAWGYFPKIPKSVKERIAQKAQNDNL